MGVHHGAAMAATKLSITGQRVLYRILALHYPWQFIELIGLTPAGGGSMRQLCFQIVSIRPDYSHLGKLTRAQRF